jgi:hypothetical protein
MRIHPRLLSVTLALAGCSSDFAPYSSLDQLRILAIAAEPATPMAGEIATFSALTYAPVGESPTLHWSWCPVAAAASDNYACPLDQAAAELLFAPYLDASAGLPSLDLGYATTAALANPFPTQALANLCATGLASPILSRGLDCDGGYPITVVLDTNTASASLRAGFVLRLPASDPAEINHNPSLAGLQLASLPLLEPLSAVRIAPGATVDLRAGVPATAAELRSIPPSEGLPGQRLERLTMSWFASAGEVDKARTSFIDGVATLDEMASNRFTAPKVESWPGDGLVTIAAVLRDDRGGAGWLVRQVLLEQAP